MKVYKYWCEPFAESLPAVREQLRLAGDYRRALVDIENRARVLLRALRDLSPEERLRYRAAIYPAQAEARRLARGAASGAGLASGTYQAIEESVDQASRTTKWFDDLGRSAPGLLAVATHQKGGRVDGKPVPLTTEQLREPNRWAELGTEPVGRPRRRGGVGAARLTELRMRIGSDDVRDPIWARCYVLMHRPLPTGALIKSVRLSHVRVGPRSRWSALFVVDDKEISAASSMDADGRTASPVVGVDIGWRKVDGGTRVAYWHGSDGREGSLVIPDAVLARDPKSDSLRAIRDRERNAMKAALLDLRDRISAGASAASDGAWYISATDHLHAWKKNWRYVRLLRDWRAAIGDAQAPSELLALEAWDRQDRHLWAWEANNRRRRELAVAGRVRLFAVALAKEYCAVAVEASGMVPALVARQERGIAKGTPRTEAEAVEERQRRLNAKRVGVVAPSLVRAELKQWAAKYGARYVEVDPANTTAACAACGHLREIVDRSELQLTCDRCGVTEDQDRTAARNLASAAVRGEAGAPLASPKASKPLRARRTRRRRSEEGVSA